VNADEALKALSDSYWTNVDQAKRMAEAIDTVGLEIERLRRRKRDLAEVVPADTIIAIERARLARIIREKFDNGDWDTTYSAVPGISFRAVMGLLEGES
jgi:hypothetical protein